MGADAEREDAGRRPRDVELRRIRIHGRIAVGGREDDEDRVARAQLDAGDIPIARDEASRVLDRRVVTKDLENHRRDRAS